MPEEARKALPPGGSQGQPQTTPAVTAGSTTGGDPGRFSTTSVPCLSSAWLQPAGPTWLVRPNAARANAFTYLPPHTPIFQGTLRRDEGPPIPHSVAPPPSIPSGGMMGNLSGMFVGPLSCQFGPAEQWYSHLQPVTSLQIVPMQPPGQGQQTSGQDGRGLFLHSHSTLGPLPRGERPTGRQAGRSVGLPPPPRQDMIFVLKQVEPRTLVKAPPATGLYRVPSASGNRPVTSIATKVTDAPSASPESHQPSSVPPEDGGSGKLNNSLFAALDEFPLPENLLGQKYPEIEKLIASFEPLLESIETEHSTEDRFFKEPPVLPSKEPAGIHQGQMGRGPSHENNLPTPESSKRRKTGMCPLTTSLPLLTTQEIKVSHLAERATENNTQTQRNPCIPETICLRNGQAQLAKRKIPGPPQAPKLRDGSQLKRPPSEKSSTASQAWGKGLDQGPESATSTPTLPAKLGPDAPRSTAPPQCPKATASNAEGMGKRKPILLDVEFFHIPSLALTGGKTSKPKARPAGVSQGPRKEQSSQQCGKGKTPREEATELPQPQTLPHPRDKPAKGLPAVPQHPATALPRDLPTDRLPAKKSCAKRKRAEHEPPTDGKLNILPPGEETSAEKNPEKRARVSSPQGPQTDKKNKQPKRATTAKATQRNPKVVAKPCTETSQPVPKSKLALKLIESVQVFHPLGKSGVSTMPARKEPPTTSSSCLPWKPVSTVARPLPNLPPYPLPKPLLKPLSKPPTKTLACSLTQPVPPTAQPRAPPSSLARPWQKSAQLQQPLPRPKPHPAGPKASVSSRLEAKPSIAPHSQAAVSKAQPRVVGRTSHPPPREGLPRQDGLQQPLPRPKPHPTGPKASVSSRPEAKPSIAPHSQAAVSKAQPRVVGRTSHPKEDGQRPSSSQSQQRPGSTTIDFWPRTLPRDHHLVFRYSPPPPVLPFEVAFAHWKPPRDDLEESTPITPEQRPEREMMKRKAQREREEAAQWTSVGRAQFFVERKKEKDLSVWYGYP